MSDFGAALLRVKPQGMNLNELSRRVGCDRSHVTRLLNGTRGPSPEFIDKLSAALELPERRRDYLIAVAFRMSGDVIKELSA